jgi:hypothetical protein
MKILTYKFALHSTAVALLVGGSMAQAATGLPPVHHMGAIDYVTGGVGQQESSAIERASAAWPLTLEFAVKDKHHADFIAGVGVAIRDARQNIELKVRSDGPFLLAKLPPGHYLIDASFGNKTLQQKVDVVAGHPAKVVLVWPEGTTESMS